MVLSLTSFLFAGVFACSFPVPFALVETKMSLSFSKVFNCSGGTFLVFCDFVFWRYSSSSWFSGFFRFDETFCDSLVVPLLVSFVLFLGFSKGFGICFAAGFSCFLLVAFSFLFFLFRFCLFFASSFSETSFPLTLPFFFGSGFWIVLSTSGRYKLFILPSLSLPLTSLLEFFYPSLFVAFCVPQ